MLLSFLFIYFVGKAFYSLAEDHLKNKWLFAILGVASYYAGTFIGAIILGIYYALNDDFENVENGNFERSPSTYLVVIPIGILTCWIFYRILKSFWGRKSSAAAENEVLDANLINNKTDL